MIHFFIVGLTQLTIDTLIFTTMVKFGFAYLISNIISRGLAALTGYLINGRFTFKSKLTSATFIKFWVYWLFMTGLSTLFIYCMSQIFSLYPSIIYSSLYSKVIAEFTLFFVSYFIAKSWVYRNDY